jgi:hypothetical protein
MHLSVPKKASVRPFTGIKMSTPVEEGGQDDDDILGSGSRTRLMQTLVCSGNRMRKVMTHK